MSYFLGNVTIATGTVVAGQDPIAESVILVLITEEVQKEIFTGT